VQRAIAASGYKERVTVAFMMTVRYAFHDLFPVPIEVVASEAYKGNRAVFLRFPQGVRPCYCEVAIGAIRMGGNHKAVHLIYGVRWRTSLPLHGS
jgi:hypothetical protein